MDINDVKHKLNEFLAGSFRIHQLNDDENIFETGIVHSLFYMQLFVFIEKTFAIELDENQLDLVKLRSINAIANLIVSKI